MLTIGLLIALTMQQPPVVDSVLVYSEILAQVRAEFPARAVALATTRSGVECMPLCGAGLRDPDGGTSDIVDSAPEITHSTELLNSLRSRGLVEDTCEVREGWYGCPDHPEHLFVALGEITTRPRRGPEPV